MTPLGWPDGHRQGKRQGTRRMDCDDAARLIHSYLDGELGTWQRRSMSRHLDHCPFCAGGFRVEQRVRERVVETCREQAPADLHRRVADLLHGAPPDGPFGGPPPGLPGLFGPSAP